MKTFVLIAVLFAANVCHGFYLPPDLDPLRNSQFGGRLSDMERDRLLQGLRSNNPLGYDQMTSQQSYGGGRPAEVDIASRTLKKLAVSYPLEWAMEHPQQIPVVRTVGRLLVNSLRNPYGAAALALLYPSEAN